MADVSQSNSNFIQGLSALWTRFFKDKPTLDALYTGTEIPIGQAYLNLLSNVLNISIRETPLFRKEFFKLLTIREDLLVYDAPTATYQFEITPLSLRDFKFLYNRIFGPTVILENMIDFSIQTVDVLTQPTGTADYLVFTQNLFDWKGGGQPIPGVAYRSVPVLQQDGTTELKRELAFWVPDAQIDNYDLYLNYGYLLNYFAPSSESYRALLRGIMRYFVLGPTAQHVVSTLNVILGLPVIQNNGEVLLSVDTSNPLYNTVKTSAADYQFDAGIPLRTDVLNLANWGTLTFQAFDSLTLVFQTYDSIDNPTWYYDFVISPELLPDETVDRRTISPVMYENLINNPLGGDGLPLVHVGDPGFFIGADDDGFVPTGRLSYRHLFAYIVFERFLKYHTFTVEFDPSVVASGLVPYPRLQEDIINIIKPGKSAYTFLVVQPSS